MSAIREREARRELDWLCRQALAWPVLVEQTSEVIRRVVPHERFCFHTVDPATKLFTGGLARNLERADGYPRMLHNEYLEDDVNKWAMLAALERPVGSLTAATGGRRERSTRFRELMRPQQCAWELRASLVSDSAWWGAIALYRSDRERDFGERELDFVAAVSTNLAMGFRRSLFADGGDGQYGSAHEPGLILFDAQGEVVEVAPSARHWLVELRGDGDAAADWLPVEVYAVAARSRVKAEDGSNSARARVRAPSGRWLTLEGVALAAERAAVVIGPARRGEVAPLIVDSYGLTGRERAIIELVLEGLRTSTIAQRLSISPYTVQDHLKAIFEKAGVRSRRELVAQVFYAHHFPRIMAGRRPGVGGAFDRSHRGAGLVRL